MLRRPRRLSIRPRRCSARSNLGVSCISCCLVDVRAGVDSQPEISAPQSAREKINVRRTADAMCGASGLLTTSVWCVLVLCFLGTGVDSGG